MFKNILYSFFIHILISFLTFIMFGRYVYDKVDTLFDVVISCTLLSTLSAGAYITCGRFLIIKLNKRRLTFFSLSFVWIILIIIWVLNVIINPISIGVSLGLNYSFYPLMFIYYNYNLGVDVNKVLEATLILIFTLFPTLLIWVGAEYKNNKEGFNLNN